MLNNNIQAQNQSDQQLPVSSPDADNNNMLNLIGLPSTIVQQNERNAQSQNHQIIKQPAGSSNDSSEFSCLP